MSDSRNLTLLTDLYELTMMQGYFKNHTNPTVVFDAFFRKNPFDSSYSIAAGLEQAIEYIKDLHFSQEDVDYLRSTRLFDEDFLEYLLNFRFSGDIYAIPEGTVVFPREPLVKVIAPIMEAQLVETALLNIVNHQSLIATKASRVVYAAGGDGIMEFGLRRAQGPDAGLYGARAAMIGGCIGTSCVLTGQMFNVPVKGTHAHSWIMSFPDEYTAFKKYAELYPDACILLVDTYDTLGSGVPNAIRVFKEMREAGIKSNFYGIRLDSGDLAYLSKNARCLMMQDSRTPLSPLQVTLMSTSFPHSRIRAQPSPHGVSAPTSSQPRTVLHSAVYTSLPRYRMKRPANLFLRLSSPKTQRRLPIRATRQYSVSMTRRTARLRLTSSPLPTSTSTKIKT